MFSRVLTPTENQGLSGMSRSVGFTAYNTIAFADVSANEMTAANTLSSTLQQLAAGLGITLRATTVSRIAR